MSEAAVGFSREQCALPSRPEPDRADSRASASIGWSIAGEVFRIQTSWQAHVVGDRLSVRGCLLVDVAFSDS